jgi:hypothetical protein
MENAPSYRYVGPAVLAEHARPGLGVITVTSARVLARWLAARPADELSEPFTFVVSLDGQLRLAARRSEHVDCAAGRRCWPPVRCFFAGRGRVVRHRDQQPAAGYCPDPDSWLALARTLDLLGLAHPGGFTHTVIFRRCPACGQLNIVRDGDFDCAVCDSPLPAQRNISPA